MRVFLVLSFLFSALSGCALARPTTYAQLSSAQDQTGSAVRVQLDVNDGSHGIHNAGGVITVSEAGVYVAIAAPQLTRTAPGNQEACGDFWLRRNGADVPNSNVRLCLAGGETTDVVVSQSVMRLDMGDRLEVYMTTRGAKIDAIELSDAPRIPSIIFSLAKL